MGRDAREGDHIVKDGVELVAVRPLGGVCWCHTTGVRCYFLKGDNGCCTNYGKVDANGVITNCGQYIFVTPLDAVKRKFI